MADALESPPRRSGAPPRSRAVPADAPRGAGDALFAAIGGAAAAAVALVLVVIFVAVAALARPSVTAFGAGFVTGRAWDPVHHELGALPFVYGTLVTSFVALVLAVPVGVAVAVFLTDLGAPPLRRPVAALVDLLAAVPSVVYGLWASLVLAPLLRSTLEPLLVEHVGPPLFRGPSVGVGLLCASLVLAVMILPTIAVVAREVLRAVPSELREGGLALGATPWDVVRRIVLPHAKAGLGGAVLLGFGRAAGETMAVAMVVGGRAEIAGSLLAPGYTLSSVLANEFAEATDRLHVAALAELGGILFLLTLAFNVGARLLVARFGRPRALVPGAAGAEEPSS